MYDITGAQRPGPASRKHLQHGPPPTARLTPHPNAFAPNPQALTHTPPLAELLAGPRGERLVREVSGGAAGGGGGGGGQTFDPVALMAQHVRRALCSHQMVMSPKGHAASLRLINKR